MNRGLIEPTQSGAQGIRFVTTTRSRGDALAAETDNNMALHTGNDPQPVLHNRRWLADHSGAAQIQWLNQVHGTTCKEVRAATAAATVPEADACWTQEAGFGLAVMTADCLPVVLWDQEQSRIGIAHAGWRGLLAGVLETTLQHFQTRSVRAWIGPAIGVEAYEVGEDVYQEVARQPWRLPFCLRAPDRPDKWHLNLSGLARQTLVAAGVSEVFESGLCTLSDRRFYSYRRDGSTGRMATLVWRTASVDRAHS
ncbi:MAG: peptidoglycan editing factor PgeF [Proteobacteria bacterium]|nr:peptidoglycan editing factor PgeF [Pseudomonadota bacterium]